MERDQLADEEDVERFRGMPSGPEQRLVGADEGNGDTLVREAESLPEEVGVRRGVGDDEVGAAERAVVDAAEDARRRGAGPEARPVADQRVVERDERVEDDGASARDPAGGGHVEVTRVADDDDVGVVLPAARQRPLRARHPRQLAEADRPVVTAPDLAVALDDGDPRPAEARHDLGVAGRRPVVRPEVEGLQPATAGPRRRASSAGRRGRAAARGAGS